MSDLYAIGLMGALLIGAAFLLFHMASELRKGNAGLIAGFVAGVPVSREFGWRTFLQFQVPANIVVGIVALLVGFLFLRIADNVEDIATATLAQACAVPFFGVSALALVSSPLALIYVGGLIRRPKAD